MKLAITGKGGVGKTTISALLSMAFADKGYKVFLVDADPSPSLGSALGIPEDILTNVKPISAMSSLIEERTGVKPGSSYGAMFKLNPEVDDIPKTFALEGPKGIKLLIVGTIKAAGSGCFCPENALVKRLLHHLVLRDDDVLIMDMEAGIEHLGRGTVKSMDLLLIILEPGLRSVKVAEQIKALGQELGIKRFGAILNKVQNSKSDVEVINKCLSTLEIPLLGDLPFDTNLVKADLAGLPPYKADGNVEIVNRIEKILENIETDKN